MEEIWKEIKGWEGLYSVSNLGRIKRHDAYNNCPILKGGLQFRPERIKQIKVTSQGYLITSFWKNRHRRSYAVHRLVADAFIPNPQNKKTVNHINGIKHDNRIENLEWATQKEQISHSYKIGHSKVQVYGERHPFRKLSIEDVVKIKVLADCKVCEQKELAEIFNVPKGTISRIYLGKTWVRAIEDYYKNKVA